MNITRENLFSFFSRITHTSLIKIIINSVVDDGFSLGIIKSHIINALNTSWRRDESGSPTATGSRIVRGWQVAPILRTNECDGCNKTQLRAYSALTLVTRGRITAHDVMACFMGNSGGVASTRDPGIIPFVLAIATWQHILFI